MLRRPPETTNSLLMSAYIFDQGPPTGQVQAAGSSPGAGGISDMRNRSTAATTCCKEIAGTYCLFLPIEAFHCCFLA